MAVSTLIIESEGEGALFHGALEVVGCFRMKLNISFPATGFQKLFEVDDEHKHLPFMKRVWPQKLLLIVWVKSGRVVWFESVVGTTNKVSP